MDMNALNKYNPIGIFDSGLGGISVLKEIHKILPNENLIYYGDSQNAPYGDKTVEQVRVLSESVFKKLLSYNVKCVVIACNTASICSSSFLRQTYPMIPIIAMEPEIKSAVKTNLCQNVLILATSNTIKSLPNSDIYKRFHNKANLILQPCSGLVEFIESGKSESSETLSYLKNLLSKYIGKIDSVVLGCTHYPFIRKHLYTIFGNHIKIYDGCTGTANEVKHVLITNDLLNDKDVEGSVLFLNSCTNNEKIELCKKLYFT